ncbi:hypothetical protein ACSSS7_007052 [Eimeria intestinalis]
MDREQSERSRDSNEATTSALQNAKPGIVFESYKQTALWGFLHADYDRDDRDSATAQPTQPPKQEAGSPSQQRSAGEPSRTRLVEKPASRSSSCESIFIELCELSERLEAEEEAERRTSIATTASWRSGRGAERRASSREQRASESPRPMTSEEYWEYEDNYVPPRGLPTDESPVKPAAPPPPKAPAGPRRFRRGSRPPPTSEFTMQEVVDYLMEQLPLPDVDVAQLQLVPDPEPATAADGETTSPLSELKAPGDYALEAVDRILRSGILRSDSQPHEVVSIAKFHLLCIKEEDEGSLPPVTPPLDDEQEDLFGSPRRRSSSVA